MQYTFNTFSKPQSHYTEQQSLKANNIGKFPCLIRANKAPWYGPGLRREIIPDHKKSQYPAVTG
jgi:hypothetical protein